MNMPLASGLWNVRVGFEAAVIAGKHPASRPCDWVKPISQLIMRKPILMA
ncbi:hypothetical protein [Sporomusa carbonis]